MALMASLLMCRYQRLLMRSQQRRHHRAKMTHDSFSRAYHRIALCFESSLLYTRLYTASSRESEYFICHKYPVGIALCSLVAPSPCAPAGI